MSKHRTFLFLIILVYLGVSMTYLRATPPLESSDEYKHYPFVQYVQTEGKLPVLDPDNPGRWLQEGAQPPLYYLLMAGIPIDTSDLPQVHHVNHHAFIGIPNQIHNKNLILHDPENETFPWHGTVLAIYIIRLVSIALGVGTILLTYALGCTLFDPTIGMTAAALTAWTPMFLFVSAAVNNDSLAILLGHGGLYLLVRMWQKPPELSAWWRFMLLGLVLGLGILTKLSLGGLLGLAGLILAILAWRQQRWQLFWIGGPIVLGTALLISGWWFIRNWQLYGDVTGLNAFIAVQGVRNAPLTWAGWWDEFGTFYRTFWGLFGGVNILAPKLFYITMNGLAIIGIAGLVKWLWYPENRQRLWRMGIWLLIAWIGLLLLLLLRWNVISPAFQGRLVFPALGGIYTLLAVGWRALLPTDWQQRSLTFLAIGVGITAVLLPWSTIRPAYAFPEPLTAVPSDARLEDPITFAADSGAIQLVGVTMSADQSVTPDGDPVIVTLYWQAASPVTADYLSSVHLLGRDFVSVGAIDRYPAWGMIPTSRWRAGAIYEDTYRVSVDKTAVSPAQLRVAVSLYDLDAERPLLAMAPDGTEMNPVLVGAPARLSPQTPPETLPLTRLAVPFAEGITLLGYNVETAVASPGTTVPITLYWQATDTPTQAYTVFVQLLNENRQWVSGADAPPAANFYPTSLWQSGDLIDDRHHLPIPSDLPPGTYTILVGLYDPLSGARVARLDSPADFAEFPLTIVTR